ncbi:MAG: hypothetical protein U1F43_19975 [Myxococcota bacterium]
MAARFPGFTALSERCHFAGCLHEGEPGCAVVDATPPERMARWHALLAALREAPGRRRRRSAEDADPEARAPLKGRARGRRR